MYYWLAELETQHDLLVYITDHELNDFTKLALSQSDKLIRVTNPKAELNRELINYVNQSKTLLAEMACYMPEMIQQAEACLDASLANAKDNLASIDQQKKKIFNRNGDENSNPRF